MATAITALANLTLGANAASVSFSSISSSYRDLYLTINGSMAASGNIALKINADATSTYYIIATASTSTTITGSQATSNLLNYTNTLGTDQFSMIVDFLDYSTTDRHKSVLVKSSSATSSGAELLGMRWWGTAAIGTITLTGSSNFATGTQFCLWGVAS